MDRITNLIDRNEKFKKRNPDQITIIAVHRIWVKDTPFEQYIEPQEIAHLFKTDPKYGKYTGFRMPYSFLVDRHGRAFQMTGIGDLSPHAANFNSEALGVGAIGDFRKNAVPNPQWRGMIDLCSLLCRMHDLDPLGETTIDSSREAAPGAFVHHEIRVSSLAGHDELPGGSNIKDKKCPGPYFNMDEFRWETNKIIQEQAIQEAVSLGVVA